MKRALVAFGLAVVVASPGYADPCGMVPPVWEGQQSPIRRVGPQNTYAFFKDGVETLVIRPGFEGDVDNFGMLIPFPSIPSIRKVSDNTFAHLAAAANPPPITVDLRPMPPRPYPSSVRMSTKSVEKRPKEEEPLRVDEVRVVKQEAVGMYEVAVLEAGSPKALSRWMDDHGYKYPKGMDKAVLDYVKERWVFVAVRARVGVKGRVDPKPGMRHANPKMKPGGSFDGHVQAMGFRFRVKEPVIPMRLSTFNEGELTNVVYFLADDGVKLRNLSKSLVAQQVVGQKLHNNVTDLLPLRVIWSPDDYDTLNRLGENQLRGLQASRNPAPHNGIARDLFASDLLAVSTGKLDLEFEGTEKQLYNINERLNLRSPQVDAQVEAEMVAVRTRSLKGAARSLTKMTLTVLRGDFPRDYLAKNNLYVDKYALAAAEQHKLSGKQKAEPHPLAISPWNRPAPSWAVPVVDRLLAKRIAKKWPKLKYWAKEEFWTP